MEVFRSHLDVFANHGNGCCPKPLPPAQSRGINITDMMKLKFSKSRKHAIVAWVTFMGILLLAFIYAENTKWSDSWFRTPTKYNISELLEGGMDDDMILGPAVEVEDAPLKGKAGKTKKEAEEEEPTVDKTDDAQDEDKTPKAAKATKVAKEDKEDGVVQGEAYDDDA